MAPAEGTGFAYVTEEQQLSQERGVKIAVPLRVFTLEGLGIDPERFLREIIPTYLWLPWDEYDMKRDQVEFLARRYFHQSWTLRAFLADYWAGRKTLEDMFILIADLSQDERRAFERIKPRRKRAVARFLLKRVSDRWVLERQPPAAFTQKVGADDPRAFVRVFQEMSKHVTDHGSFQRLLMGAAEMVRSVRPNVLELELTAHQVSTFADAAAAGDNAPEGIHQDGADYIVSALVVERDGVIGGESFVYGPDKKTVYLQRTLQPGEGIFQADQHSPLWHDVTLIEDDPATPPTDGKRSIFGFDLNVVKES